MDPIMPFFKASVREVKVSIKASVKVSVKEIHA